MDEKPDQILGHIEAQRSELGRNLSELETRVRRGTDWKTYFDRNPMMMLGVALGGGLLLGTAVGNKRKHHRGSSYSSSRSSAGALGFASAGTLTGGGPGSHSSSALASQQRQQISETMDHMKAALIGFGIAKAKEFMCQAIPGFDQHLSEAEQKRGAHGSQQAGFSGESGSGTQSPSWDSDAYTSGGRDNSRTYGNMGSSSTGETEYRGSYAAGEPVGAGTSPIVTP